MPGGLGSFRILIEDLRENHSASIAQHLGGLRQSATGSEVITGTCAQHLGGLRQTAIDHERISGSCAQRLSGFVQHAEGGMASVGCLSLTAIAAAPLSATTPQPIPTGVTTISAQPGSTTSMAA